MQLQPLWTPILPNAPALAPEAGAAAAAASVSSDLWRGIHGRQHQTRCSMTSVDFPTGLVTCCIRLPAQQCPSDTVGPCWRICRRAALLAASYFRLGGGLQNHIYWQLDLMLLQARHFIFDLGPSRQERFANLAV